MRIKNKYTNECKKTYLFRSEYKIYYIEYEYVLKSTNIFPLRHFLTVINFLQ